MPAKNSEISVRRLKAEPSTAEPTFSRLSVLWIVLYMRHLALDRAAYRLWPSRMPGALVRESARNI